MSAAPRWRAEGPLAWLRDWECAHGTVQGRDHALARRNSQDAIDVHVSEHALVAVLSDGCGAARYSETGARLVATLLARALARALARRAAAQCPWQPTCDVDGAIDEVLDVLARAAFMGEEPSAPWLVEHLLATLLAVVVTPTRAIVFRIGDGVVGVNGGIAAVEAPGNAPPYLAYRLVTPRALLPSVGGLVPVVEWEGASDALESVVLATDGASALPATTDDPHGTLRDWLADDALFARPHALGRRLALLARDEQVIDWDARVVHRKAGVLRDDTTVLLLRRRAAGGSA